MFMQTMLKRMGLIVATLLMVFVISACGGPATPYPGTGLDEGEYEYGTPTEPADNTTGEYSVKTATAMVDGQSVTILTDEKGWALYYFTPDSKEKTACIGGCAVTWPPLVYEGQETVQADAELSGTLDTYTTEHGNQVRYNGHYLYTYAADQKPGDVKGHKVDGTWFVATTDLKEK